MNPRSIATALLEAEFNAKDFLVRLLQRPLMRFPRSLRPLLRAGNDYGPSDEFLQRMTLEGPEETWQLNDPDDLPVWPVQLDADDDGLWSFRVHHGGLAVRNRRLFVQVWDVEPDGDSDVYAEAAWGSPGHQRLRRRYSRRAHARACLAYVKHVQRTGLDPLEWFDGLQRTRAARLARSEAQYRRLVNKLVDRDADLFIIP